MVLYVVFGNLVSCGAFLKLESMRKAMVFGYQSLDGLGRNLFPPNQRGSLLRKPLNECSNIDAALDSAATAENFVLVYGDFQDFVIADRVGTTVEFIPQLFGASRRPTGQRGGLMWFRTGSDSVNDNAFRLLNVATTA